MTKDFNWDAPPISPSKMESPEREPYAMPYSDAALPSTGPSAPLKTPDDEGVLETAWRILRRQWPIVLSSAVLAAGLGAGLSARHEKEYAATANLLFGTASDSVLATSNNATDDTRLAATNSGLLRLGVVADVAADKLHHRMSAAQIAAAVSVVTNPDADLVGVKAVTPSPQLSADIANAYSKAFIEFRQRSARKQIENALAVAQEGLAAMTPEQRSGAEGQALSDRINQLQTAKSLQTGGAELVQPASVPTSPSSPRPKRNGILGGMLGAILGFALASIRERRDRAIKTVEELEETTRWPVLTRVPRSRLLDRGAELSLRSPEAESFRMLRASLRYFSVDGGIEALLVTSARSREGKSTTARRLAEAMAAMGDRVVLVDADMHRASDSEISREHAPGGLSGYLIGMHLADVLIQVPVGDPEEGRSLSVVPSGPMPPNPSELLESARMHQLMGELEQRFDIVILDSPPLPVLSDASTLVAHVYRAIVVAALGKTTPQDLREVSNQLSLLGGEVLGVVANFAPVVDYYQGR